MDLSRPKGSEHGEGRIDWDRLAKDSRFTESSTDLTNLYDIIRFGQISYDELRHFSTDWLVFVGAHDPAVESFEISMDDVRNDAALTQPEREKALHDLAAMKNKLEQNARRAKLELEYRRVRYTRRWMISAGVFAALLGIAAGFIGAHVGKGTTDVRPVPATSTTTVAATPTT